MYFPPEISKWIVIALIAFVIVALYKNLLKPSFVFFITILAMLLLKIVTPEQFLVGFSNKQIIVIFLLIFVTGAIQKNINIYKYLDKLFTKEKKPRTFMIQMGGMVSFLSALINNTPLVAFMIPYVYNWCRQHSLPPSKFLIPLSYFAMLGGMLTVIGTSTNLVLNGFLEDKHETLLTLGDYIVPGLLVVGSGILYISTVGLKILPINKKIMQQFHEKKREYIVETKVSKDSGSIGKSIVQAGLRNLDGVFLYQIIRKGVALSPVSPNEVINENDVLIFTGSPIKVGEFLDMHKDLMIPKQEFIVDQKHDKLIEAIIPSNSSLSGQLVKESNFRDRFNAAIIAIHRNGERLGGRIGEIRLELGDLLLLSVGSVFQKSEDKIKKDILTLSTVKDLRQENPTKVTLAVVFSLLFIGLAIAGFIQMFICLLLIISVFAVLSLITIEDIQKDFDFGLALILVCSLTLGEALITTGGADMISHGLLGVLKPFGTIGIISGLFIVTVLITNFVTNVAAVSVVFPIAYSLTHELNFEGPQLYLTIAFAASAAFATPFGYQTNLMVYGPGGYTFKDYLKIGLPFTVIYSIICIWYLNSSL